MNDAEHKYINNMRNVCDKTFQIIGSRTAEFKLVENSTVDDRCASDLKSGGSAKQEGGTGEGHSFFIGFSIRFAYNEKATNILHKKCPLMCGDYIAGVALVCRKEQIK